MTKFNYKFYDPIELEKLFTELGISRKTVISKSHSVMKEQKNIMNTVRKDLLIKFANGLKILTLK